MIDFALTDRMRSLKERTEAFIREQVIPCEQDPRQTGHALDDALRNELMDKARAAGLLSPHVGEEFGGLGCDMREMAIVFEAAGYSLLGPQARTSQRIWRGKTTSLASQRRSLKRSATRGSASKSLACA